MVESEKQIEAQEVLLPPALIAGAVIEPIRRKRKGSEKLGIMNMGNLFALSTCKSAYHASWVASLEKAGKHL